MATLTACGSDDSDGPPPVVNAAPVANAGATQNVIAGTTVVTLDGSASTDPNGDTLKYNWVLTTRPTGSSAALSDPASAKPTFVADLPGTYLATLVVSDGALFSTPSTITLTAAMGNVAPVANAGSAQSVVTGTTVMLDGSASTDANNDVLTYAWTLTTRPTGSTATLTAPTTAKPTFLVDAAGTYVASLKVSDGKLESTAATVTITATVANAAPVAKAGSAQTVVTGSVVNLDGSASSDANGDTLTYAWTLTTRPTGSAATLSSATAVKPTFTADVNGTYVATLVVNDGKLSSAASTVAITAQTVAAYASYEQMPYNTPSLGAEAYDFTSLGERIQLQAGSPHTLHSISVVMSSWACQTGEWNLGTCATTDGATFTHPITLRVYDGNGTLLKTVTKTFTLPYRPSADAACLADARQWKAADGNCYNGKAALIEFDLRELNVTLPGDAMAFDLSYNTRSHGPSPIGVTGPYDSLNIGLAKVLPTIGTDLDPGIVIWSGVPELVDAAIPYNIMSRVLVGAP